MTPKWSLEVCGDVVQREGEREEKRMSRSRAGEVGGKRETRERKTTHQQVHRPQRCREQQGSAQVGRLRARRPGAARQDGGRLAQDGGQVDAQLWRRGGGEGGREVERESRAS